MSNNEKLKVVSFLLDYLNVSDETKKKFNEISEEILSYIDDDSEQKEDCSDIYDETIKCFKDLITIQMISDWPVKMYSAILRSISSRIEPSKNSECSSLSDGTYLSFDTTGVVTTFLDLESRNALELLNLIHEQFPETDQVPFDDFITTLKLGNIKSPNVRRLIVYFYKLYGLKIHFLDKLVNSNLTDADFSEFDFKFKKIDALIDQINNFIATRNEKLILLPDKVFNQDDFGPVLIMR